MLNYILLSFAFSAGAAAFFSPCSVALLPGFITYYLSKKTKQHNIIHRIIEGAIFGLLVIIGFFLVFATAGGLVIYFGHKIKAFIPLLGIITGFLLLILGIGILIGKDMILKIPKIGKLKSDSSPILFGIFYAVGALGCTFPLFVTVIVAGLSDESVLSGMMLLLAYIVGMSVLMLITTIGTVLAREAISKKIAQILPYVHKISAVIIILAGAYMIYYNFAFNYF